MHRSTSPGGHNRRIQTSFIFGTARILIRRGGARVALTLAVSILIALTLLLGRSAAFAASTASPERPSVARAADRDTRRAKRVLMLATGSRFSIAFPILEQNAVEKLRQLHPDGLDFYSEYLDIIRFPTEKYRRILRNYLRDKYVEDIPDLNVMVAPVAASDG